MIACPACAEDNPARARFCLNCGAPLQARTVIQREQRKTVTVLFSDVVGSTGLGEQLDPESLRAVMGRYFAAMKPVLERHGGTVEKFIGDAIMAVFGIPRLHEDDALRAVRAAQDMRAALATLNRELEAERGVRIAVRTGINTGEVVAGDPAGGQTLVTGDAVNVAARLEQAAGAGEILLGEATYRLVRDAVEVEQADDLALRGKTLPVAAASLIFVKPYAEAHVRRLDSPLIGRERELDRLRGVYEQAVGDGSCQLFTLLGPAGVGKSKLVAEFAAGLPADTQLLRGRCLPYGEGITYWPLGEVVKQAAGVVDTDDAAAARAKLGLLLGNEREGDLIAGHLAAAIGLASDHAPQEEIFWAVRRLLEALARRAPLVVVWDDIHWAEPTFLDLIEHVADWSRNVPLLLLCPARPELLDGRPGWGGGKLNSTTILLEPLPADAAARLIDNLPGGSALDQRTRARITEAAEGNPLFVEEMLGMLHDEGYLVRREGDWEVAGDLSAVRVPPSVSALLAARLDRLAPEERAVAERGAVVGRVFERAAVAELAPEPLRAAVTTHLLGLVRKELVRPDDPGLTGDAYRFRHILIRDAAYEAVPKSERAELHQRFAAWLQRITSARAAEYEEIVGYHLEQAHRYRRELGSADDMTLALARRASELLDRAGQRARARGDLSALLDLLARAADLLPAADARRLELLIQLAEANFSTGDLAGARALLGQIDELAERTANRRIEAIGHVLQSQLRLATDPATRTTDLETAIAEAERIVASDDAFGQSRLLDARYNLYIVLCRWAQAGTIAAQAYERALQAGDLEAATRSARSELNALHWGPAPASSAIVRGEELRRELGGHGTAAILDELLAPLYAMQGRLEEARAAYRAARRYFEERGMATRLAFANLRVWHVEWIAGDFAASARAAEAGVERAGALDETSVRSTLAGQLAESLYELGRLDEAERASLLAEQLGSSDDLSTQILWRTARAKVRAAQGRFDEARRLAREAIDVALTTDFLNLQALAFAAIGHTQQLAGNRAEAVAAYRQALESFERKEDQPEAERIRLLLAPLLAPADA